MAGRPNNVERLVRDYVLEKPDPVIDVELDLEELQRRASEIGIGKINLYEAMRRLQDKRQAHRLQAGRYVVRDEPAPTARLWSLDPVAEAVLRRLGTDYYVSWHAAFWHYGLIDQQSRRVAVAVRRRKRPVRIGAQTIQFVLVSEQKFFGYETVTGLEWPVAMATPSRALLDAFDRPELVGPPAVIVEALRRACQEDETLPEQLVEDAMRLDVYAINRRLGFFLDLLGIPGSERLLTHLGTNSADVLFPGYKPHGRVQIDPVWHVYRDPGTIATALELK
jgi:predicted transcriptional regulator of viral defense system